ncbi:CdaR family transcriptional regulator [Protofrankia sp. BMG5.30]|uniref:PucR family transcriptional regulator n=1 Tax=Protofrankia sp. BMG5.30 TaxID=1834514 RepID=UPI000976C881|nr:helix-turn-helix domain-containing protein [Protofrankia sp. BMG5.30]ONH38031.1 hypothetical protein BL254_00890 [Protofrankia sp. BMG5.30]
MPGKRDTEPALDVPKPAEYASATEAIQRCAHELLLRSAEIAVEITEQVLAGQPTLVPNRTPAAIDAVRESTDQNVGAIFSTLAFGIPATAIEPPLGARNLLRHSILGGGDVTDLLRAYHYGHGLLWQKWSAHVGERVVDLDLLREVLSLSSQHIFTFVDHSCAHLVDEYHAEFGGHVPRVFQRRAPSDLICELVADDPVDEIAVSSLLRYDVRAHHVAMVLAPTGAGGDVRRALDDLGAAAASAVLTLPVGDGTWWAWFAWPARPDEDTLARIAATPLVGTLGGMGSVGRGRAGFRRSHYQARDAERVARLSGQAGAGVVRHRDVELAALLCADPGRAQRLADERLGALGRRNEDCRRLRETLLTFLSQGCSRTRAARLLHVHHKTVSYRLAQAEELLGRPLSEDILELGAALLIEHTLHGG